MSTINVVLNVPLEDIMSVSKNFNGTEMTIEYVLHDPKDYKQFFTMKYTMPDPTGIYYLKLMEAIAKRGL